MAKVRLDFVPPSDPDIASLHIYESDAEAGPFSEIEEVTSIGAYPAYITRYTTTFATDPLGWFSIAWENVDGIMGEMSASIQGGRGTAVHEILSRVSLRDSNLNEKIVVQSAEYVLAEILGYADPYDPDIVLTYKEKEAATLLTLARSHLQTIIAGSGSSESFTAGLVSMKSETGTASNLKDLIKLITEQANALLGISNSFVLLLADIDPIGLGGVSAIDYDQSRLLVTEIL